MYNAGLFASSSMKIPIYGSRMRTVMLSASSAAASNGKTNGNDGRSTLERERNSETIRGWLIIGMQAKGQGQNA
jgi:hypothetical protein